MTKSSKTIIKEAIEATEQVTAKEVSKNLEHYLILDVREKEEIDVDPGIKNSIKIPRGLLEFYADEESPIYDNRFNTDKIIIVMCALGLRGALATKTLKDMGYDNVKNLDGGLNSWREEE